MKRLATGAIALALIGTPALAADRRPNDVLLSQVSSARDL